MHVHFWRGPCSRVQIPRAFGLGFISRFSSNTPTYIITDMNLYYYIPNIYPQNASYLKHTRLQEHKSTDNSGNEHAREDLGVHAGGSTLEGLRGSSGGGTSDGAIL